MNILEKLFGSAARVKILKLFLLSPEKVFTPKEASKILKISKNAASKEIRLLVSINFLKKRPNGLVLSPTFSFLLALRTLLISASPVSREKMLKFFKNKGKIKLLVLGGVFTDDFFVDILDGSKRLDLLIAGELKKGAVEKFIRKMEAEVGKELNWTLLGTREFEQRFAMHDKLLRDLFDYPHEFLINKLGVE
ncbi:hypothetical protein A3B05_03060 [Candidatus Giovannonibacteria bacterium RIFCSPLOWO2_01_FULL_43_160]|uniref:HTH arsR-type domain-containing protein n=2 Tax=Candidatus Giovannoniibacteriota TaxID=1752738 RepID=A0A1F5XVN7_9BACT|nr:MAG: putative transcriptional regulator [Candidatus Giovannonibacteria bacterium GW2011_GWB1_43_13]KKS99527.1 MAG: putative transcriptional regulator [Candidatus Giovannonibacteria bacterium GW2011_GWA1_43_15]KKT21437.1 MAG: putative transcriptional regulator [Candidatus Giovannonibacteria bacterium GW2011_GWC2_43_8]KKT63487.1 MAG: putative transcriptional regulator [Candidatus Giovannonibacteria bacterium GW2011_GWA2_44_26]OGF58140.1 MAG: hypothetical protein A2652_02865 [Candidatus Giovann